MKNKLLLSALLLTAGAFAQNKINNAQNRSKPEIPSVLKFTDPKIKIQEYKSSAAKGDAKAMKLLGDFYLIGVGTAVDAAEALNWYKRAGAAGYTKGWECAAYMYKQGISVPQNFKKAFQYYSKGARAGDAMCLYLKGYMTFKGFGTPQNYSRAYRFFKEAAAWGDQLSYFMLGICFRNGYGVKANTMSAKYWLTKAAVVKRDKRAPAELKKDYPENRDLKTIPNIQPKGRVPIITEESGYVSVHQKINPLQLAGNYRGYSIRYDWSGQHIIGQPELIANLKVEGSKLSGIWHEAGQDSVVISGDISDKAIVFNESIYCQRDHYSPPEGVKVQLKESKFRMFESTDSVYLSGTLTTYATQAREPEKPQFILLVRAK